MQIYPVSPYILSLPSVTIGIYILNISDQLRFALAGIMARSKHMKTIALHAGLHICLNQIIYNHSESFEQFIIDN